MKTYLKNFTISALSKRCFFIIIPFVNQKTLLPRLRYSFFFSTSFLLVSLLFLIACVQTSINSDGNTTPVKSTKALINSLELSIAGQDYPVTFDNNGAASVDIPSPLASFPPNLTIKRISFSDGATVKDQDGKTVTSGSTVAISANGGARSITLTVTAEDGSTTRTFTVSLIPQSSDALIDRLTLEIAGGDYLVPFDGNGNGSIAVSASLKNPPTKATVKQITLSSGATANQNGKVITATSIINIATTGNSRSISFSVTAQDGTLLNYTINVTILNSDANIDSLILVIDSTDYTVGDFDANDSAEIKFESPGATVPASLSIKTLLISDKAAAVDRNGATITTGNNVATPSTVNILNNRGNYSISITVTAEDNTTRTYTVNIVPVSSTVAITALTLNIRSTDYQVSFTNDRAYIAAPITNTTDTIPASVTVTSITLATSASATDAASVAVTNGSIHTLVDGGGFQRSLTFVVTNSTNSLTRTYEIVVQFANNQTEINTLALTVGQTDFPITFDQNNQTTIEALYLFRPNPNVVTIKNLTFSKGATVTDSGGSPIANDSSIPIDNSQIIILTVIAEDGVTTRDYTITLDYNNIILSGHTQSVLSVAISPDNSKIASGSVDDTIKIWDANATSDTTTTNVTLSGHSGNVRSVAFSPDSNKLASSGNDNTIKIWNANATDDTTNPIVTLSGHTGWVVSISYHPDGSKIASASHDNSVRIWNANATVDTTPSILNLSAHSSEVETVAFSPDGSRFASGSNDDTIKIWDASKLDDNTPAAPLIATLSGHTGDVVNVAFSPDSSRLASGSWDNTIKIWDATVTANTSTPIATLSGHTSWIYSVAFHPDGSQLASGSWDDTIRIWDANTAVNTSTPIATLSAHTDNVFSVAYSRDRLKFVSGSADNSIKIWQ